MSRKVKKATVYMDNAAATPIDPKVIKEMVEAMPLYANPSSFNDGGRMARKRLDESRTNIARFLGARSGEIIFTSSGSESNNLAIKGAMKACRKKGEIITTPIEHPSVLGPIKELERYGYKVKYLNVDKDGFVDVADLERKLTDRTLLVSVMYANNEIGTIQPIAKISKAIQGFQRSSLGFRNSDLELDGKTPFFHVDACQATEYLDMDVNHLGADLITFNGTKIYGPRGVGVLYVRRGVTVDSEIKGGDQEFGMRAGTENLPAILGLARAVELISKSESKRVSDLRDYFINQIKSKLPEVRLNGPEDEFRLPNNISISMPGLTSEVILLELDKYGIYAGSGSACTARSVEPSHVLRAIGVEDKYIHGALRFSLGRQTTKKEIDYVLKIN
jgi:cysteine desulfurase